MGGFGASPLPCAVVAVALAATSSSMAFFTCAACPAAECLTPSLRYPAENSFLQHGARVDRSSVQLTGLNHSYVERPLVVKKGHELEGKFPVPLSECKAMCDQTAACRAFSYSATQQVCYLTDADATAKNAGMVIPYVDWKTYVKLPLDGALPTRAMEWKTLWSKGSYGDFTPNEWTLNAIVLKSGGDIIRRECSSCTNSHKDIFMRRRDMEDYNAYQDLLHTWRGDVGFRTRFNLYSTLDDALSGENAWQFCNGNDRGVGFPRDCGPRGDTGYQWISPFRHPTKHDYKFSVQAVAGVEAL